MFFKVLFPVVLAFVTSACVPEATPPEVPSAEASAPMASGDRSQNALDWAGSYEGVLPCADCSGIVTRLALDAAGNFTMSELYQDKATEAFLTKGAFTWDRTGSIVTLDVNGNGRMYKVGEGRIWALDLDGKEITSGLAAHYILAKIQ